MTPHRTLLAAVGLATAATVALTGCSAKSSQSTASGPTTTPATRSTSTPNAAASAADKLTTAIQRLQGGDGFNFTLNEGAAGGQLILGGVGSYDPVAGAITLDLKGTDNGADMEFAVTETGLGHVGSASTNRKLWVKVNFGDQNTQYSMPRKKWMALDPGKLSGPNPLPFDLSGQSDILDISYLMASVSGVQMISAVAMTGKVDLNKGAGVIAPTADELSNKVTQAAATPFAALLDPQGRLDTLTVDTRSYSMEFYRVVSFHDYGSPHAIKPPPASSVVTATAKNYEFFNS